MTTIDLVKGNALTDSFSRPITYLRISLTDRCNLRCVYCMPERGLPWLPKPEILTFEELERVVRIAASLGLRAVRLTGGEPLIRRDLPNLVERLARIDGIDDVSLSTNGLMLAEHARRLAGAGLRRVNVSLDTLREDRFEAIARRPGLSQVLAGIDAAFDAGLEPVKINVVVMRGKNDDELVDFAGLTRHRRIFVRFIELMPVEDNVDLQRDSYISATEMLERISKFNDIAPSNGPGGNGPARYFAYPQAPGAFGVISPLSHDYCERCNRVRLTANGRLRLCLFGNHEIDLRTPLRNGADDEAIATIFRSSMLIKPERHHLELGKVSSRMRAFSEIGG